MHVLLMSLQFIKDNKSTLFLFRCCVYWHHRRAGAAGSRGFCVRFGFMEEKMLLEVSFGYSDDSFAADDVGDGDDGGCICCLHRKSDLMDYRVMDNPAYDWTAEVSTQKYPINHQ